jgi:hypothetical protein
MNTVVLRYFSLASLLLVGSTFFASISIGCGSFRTTAVFSFGGNRLAAKATPI